MSRMNRGNPTQRNRKKRHKGNVANIQFQWLQDSETPSSESNECEIVELWNCGIMKSGVTGAADLPLAC